MDSIIIANKHKTSRRDFLFNGASSSAILLLTQLARPEISPSTTELLLYVGTYTTDTKSQGIYVYGFDWKTGKLNLRATFKGVVDPSFLAIDSKRQYLYAVNELVEYEGKPGGSVSSFAIDQKTGSLSFINKQPSLGGAPCHITCCDNGRFVLVANYVGGNVSVFPIGKGGKIGAAIDVMQLFGSGPNKERQLSPHAHSVTLDRNNRFAFIADLGTDKVMIYKFDENNGKLKPNPIQAFFAAKPGAGPRHFAFHPNGRNAFVINELDSTISSFEYDEKVGTLREIKTISTLSPEYGAANACADVHVSTDGRILYGSNRGQDSIAAFTIGEKDGVIAPIENTPTGGKRPRNFALDPSGNFLLAANQETNNITVFNIDKATGRLRSTGINAEVPAPVCLKFVRLGS